MSALEEASSLLKAGDVVAFPTETVYGLGANALDEAAVSKIFFAKGRPAHNPLIVHVADIAQARALTTDWTPEAEALARELWPGPLTLVLKKNGAVPGIVTAGGDTVAIRCPDHPVALALLRKCGFPLAAPSANRSNYISPTSAGHVLRSLNGRIPLILDGGPCMAGIESTVLSLVEMPATILRPGPIHAAMLQKYGIPVAAQGMRSAANNEKILTSPGQMLSHYAPDKPLILVQPEAAATIIAGLRATGKHVGLMQMTLELSIEESAEAKLSTQSDMARGITITTMPDTPELYARLLYATLYMLDAKKIDAIVCELPPDEPAWSGIKDRLRRAATRTE